MRCRLIYMVMYIEVHCNVKIRDGNVDGSALPCRWKYIVMEM